MSKENGQEYIIQVRNLKKHFPIRKGILYAKPEQSKQLMAFHSDIKRGETIGLVGESGCGKIDNRTHYSAVTSTH